MSNSSYSVMLRNLSKEYYQNHIGFDEYRAQRKMILDKIDDEFNGKQSSVMPEEDNDESSMIMKTVAFFKNTDVDV